MGDTAHRQYLLEQAATCFQLARNTTDAALIEELYARAAELTRKANEQEEADSLRRSDHSSDL